MALSLGLKAIFFITLISIFIVFFGLPSYRKFISQETIFVESLVQYNFSRPPEIKIGIHNVDYSRRLNDCVHEAPSYQMALDCINNNTYDRTQLIKSTNKPEFNNIPVGMSVVTLPSLLV